MMLHARHLAGVLGACATLACGCHGRRLQRAEAPYLTSAETARLVDEQLRVDRRLAREPIHASVDQGVAVLRGTASSLLARERALDIAKNTLGVRSVVDHITIARSDVPDAALVREILDALGRDAATRSARVTVAVHDGAVTLQGVADSWAQRRLVAFEAEATKGVTDVNDLVVVQPTTQHPDAEILASVSQRIRFDPWLDGYPILVTVQDGAVRLRGEVATIAMRERAERDGWLEGVKGVDARDISVTGRLRGPVFARSKAKPPTDEECLAAIEAALRDDPRVGVMVPRVSVRGGVARLEGTVGSMRAQGAAEEDARDTVGITEVRDDTQVAPVVGMDDQDIARAVRKQLADDVTTARETDIRVSVTKGSVLLEGHVKTSFQQLAAVGDAAVIPGVVSVEDRLVVEQVGEDLGADVEQELARDPLVDAKQIRVQVSDDRTVTLAGTVNSWTEVRAAASDAISAGARRVVNLLQVRNQPPAIEP